MKFSRIAKSKRQKQVITTLLSLVLISSLIASVFVFSTTNVNTESFETKSEVKVTKETSNSSSQEVTKDSTTEKVETSHSSTESSEEATENETIEETNIAVSEEPTVVAYTDTVVAEQPIYTETTYYYTQPAATTTAYTPAQANITLSNGNTAGAIGSDAAAQMAAATGVPQSTWESIIARESNGDPSAANASGASGLFQTMPGWGSTATVEDQVNAAINAYNAQGLSAWGY